jgi:hypothetical protein
VNGGLYMSTRGWYKTAIMSEDMGYILLKICFLNLNHEKLGAYQTSASSCSRMLSLHAFSAGRRTFYLIQQIRRSGNSVHLNLAEGCAKSRLPNEGVSLKHHAHHLSRLMRPWMFHLP